MVGRGVLKKERGREGEPGKKEGKRHLKVELVVESSMMNKS
jgi:hypothetical protein